MGTSISPVLLTLPVSANTAVPGDFCVPMLPNQFAPRRMIWGVMA